MNAIASTERFACEIDELGEAAITLNIRDQRIVTLTAFGNTWLREDQLAAALGFSLLSHFRAVIDEAHLYAGARRRTEVAVKGGHVPMTVYSLNGAHQVCQFIRSKPSRDRAERARELMDLLQLLRCPNVIRETA